jgi:hypothetical protein
MDRLSADQRINSGDSLTSINGRVRLVMQYDGNLVLYRTDDGRALWASNTAGRSVTHTIMQGDGNLVAYGDDGHAYWASNTVGHPDASVVLQDDGNLVVYGSDAAALWASNTVQWFGPRYVAGFRPSTNAPLFSNGPWPPGTTLSVNVMGLPVVNADATRMGFCGGMSFLTRDIFESGAPQLRGIDSRQIPPALAQHLLHRLVESFDGPPVVARWLAVTQALDHDTIFRGPGLFRQTLRELPAIIADVDAGILSPIGVVLTESFAPWAVFYNHVELVWGYEQAGDILTLHTYDCNRPNRDDIVIQLDISSPVPAKTISTNGTQNLDRPGTIRGLFRLPYQHRDPSPAYIDDANAAITAAPPPAMAPDATAVVRITATNRGSTSWTPAAAYRLGSQAPQDNTIWGLNRVELQSAVVDPQQTATFTFEVTAAHIAGEYDFSWRMVHDGVTWFGTQTPTLPIAVGAIGGIAQPLRQQAQSLSAQLEQAEAALARVDWSDPYTARLEAATPARQADAIKRQLDAVEAQQPTDPSP